MSAGSLFRAININFYASFGGVASCNGPGNDRCRYCLNSYVKVTANNCNKICISFRGLARRANWDFEKFVSDFVTKIVQGVAIYNNATPAEVLTVCILS